MMLFEIYGLVFMIVCIISTLTRKEFKLSSRLVGSLFFLPVLAYCAVSLVGRF